MNIMNRQKGMTSEDEPPQIRKCAICYREEWRIITIISGKNKVAGIKQKDHSVVDVSVDVESEELKSLLMEAKEESEKGSLKLNIPKTKIMTSGPITSWQIDEETVETVTDYFFGLQNHCRW